MTTTAVEREVKLDVDEDWSVPDLGDLPGVDRVVDAGEHRLVATYHDTADHRLLASRATLRRRTGGHDAGWHLKLPAGADGSRLEVRLEHESPPPAVPPELVAAVTARSRGADLVPVMELATTRRLQHLLAADGTVLAELADDTVTARAPGGPAQGWREVEVELVGGEPDLLDRAADALLAAGARRASGPSKLGRALGTPAAARPPVRRPARMPGLVLGYLRANVDALVDADARVRLGHPEGVHDLRVATRRLRSALVTHRRRLDPDLVSGLGEELRHVAAGAAAARDAEVLLDRLPAEIEALPGELRTRGSERRLRDELAADVVAAREELLAELGTPRYLALLESLEGLVGGASLPARAAAGREPRGSGASVRHELRRVRRSLRSAGRALGGEEAAPALHRVRKAAKRARYAAELVAPRRGERAVRVVAELTEVQDLLGAHQDDVVARARLRALAESSPELETFALGALHERLAGSDAEAFRAARRHVRRARRAWR